MVGIAQYDLTAQIFDLFTRETFHGTLCSHWHEYRGFYRAVGQCEQACSGFSPFSDFLRGQCL